MIGLKKNIGLVLRNGLVKGVGLAKLILAPFYSDLNTWHKTITGNSFAESITNLPGKFLPRVASLQGTDDYIDTGIKLTGNSFSITIDSKKDSGEFVSANQGDDAFTRSGIIWSTDDKVYGILSESGSVRFGVTAALTNFDRKELRLVYDGTGATNADKLKLYINGVYTVFDSFTGTIPTSLESITNNFEIGTQFHNSFFSKNLIYRFKIEGILEYYPQGSGDYEYDISGNNNHGTWVGTGARFDYDLEGSLYLNQNGYSLWEHATLDPIQVPFDINGLPLSLTAGVDIPTGYTKTRDVVASGNKWNMADSLVDFDPDGLTDNVVVNGDFSTDTDWVKGTGWTISGGKAIAVLANADLNQSNPSVEEGKTYLTSYTISNITNGSCRIVLGTGAGIERTTNGTFTEIITSLGAILVVTIDGRFQFSGSIDNVSVKEFVEPIQIFDRSNATRQTAASRAADDYDATHPYRYQINEIADPRIYDTYFEAAYKDRIFGKVVLDGTDLIGYDEELNYVTQKAGADLVTVEEYCGIQDITP